MLAFQSYDPRTVEVLRAIMKTEGDAKLLSHARFALGTLAGLKLEAQGG